MLALRSTLIACVLMALIVGICVDAQKKGSNHKRDIQVVQLGTTAGDNWLCQYSTTVASWFGINCNQPTTTVAPTTVHGQSSTAQPAAATQSTTVATTATSTPTPLQRATWCRVSNGSYLSLYQTYMDGLCTICQCIPSRMIQCNPFQCMPTYCFDNSTPVTRTGQCCTQCNSDPAPLSCTFQNNTFPHGVILFSNNIMKCWCQMGNVECRNGVAQLFDSLDLWGDGTAVWVILVVVGVILIFGTILCLGCTAFFYYYYQRNQHIFQQAYDQYYNNSGGWQPMGDQDALAVVDTDGKQAEAEQGQFESEEYLAETDKDESERKVSMPPPYALYNGAYVSEEQHKMQKL